MSVVVAPIVEGYGDVAAVPVLLRRMEPTLDVKRPVRFPKSRLQMPEHLHRAALIAASNIIGTGAVLLIMDADEECAATVGPSLQTQLEATLPNCLCRVVLPVREFEAWIVGGDDIYGVHDPDSAGNLKGRLRQNHGVYSETVDQPSLIARADLEILANRSRSFRRLQSVVREIAQLS